MCGILGLIAQQTLPLTGEQFQTALQTLQHRGPDDEGYLFYTPGHLIVERAGRDTAEGLHFESITTADVKHARCAFAHRRLSIIDLSVSGHQPMATYDRRYWVTYNGEIYNYLELRAELEALGAQFQSHTDTEVLLEAYRVWGEAMLPRLVGMFAFAILDTHQNTVFLARDHFGIKPLYLARTAWGFAFASEIRALLEIPGVSRRGNPGPMYQYLRFGERDALAPTLFRDVERLPAAHALRIELSPFRVGQPTPYWSLNVAPRNAISYPDAVSEVSRLFQHSVSLHLRSDVPVGSCLSGGLDSSAIVQHMQTLLGPTNPVNTFSFINDDLVIGEERYVDMIRGTRSHKIKPTAAEIVMDLEDLLNAHELPFDSLSIYAQYRVFKEAHEAGIKVMLDGQGSDEIFGGYYTLLGARITGRLACGDLTGAMRLAAAGPANMRTHRRRMLATALGRLLPVGLQHLAAGLLGEPVYPPWLNKHWLRAHSVVPRLRQHGRGRHALREELQLSIAQLTLPALLRYEDANAMHFSIESRVPFCTPALAEFALSLPEEFLISDQGQTKRVFRDAVAPHLPRAIVEREKVGFAVPEREWLAALHDWALHAPFEALPFVVPAEVTREVTRAVHSSGRWPAHIWRLVNGALWSKTMAVDWSSESR